MAIIRRRGGAIGGIVAREAKWLSLVQRCGACLAAQWISSSRAAAERSVLHAAPRSGPQKRRRLQRRHKTGRRQKKLRLCRSARAMLALACLAGSDAVSSGGAQRHAGGSMR